MVPPPPPPPLPARLGGVQGPQYAVALAPTGLAAQPRILPRSVSNGIGCSMRSLSPALQVVQRSLSVPDTVASRGSLLAGGGLAGCSGTAPTGLRAPDFLRLPLSARESQRPELLAGELLQRPPLSAREMRSDPLTDLSRLQQPPQVARVPHPPPAAKSEEPPPRSSWADKADVPTAHPAAAPGGETSTPSAATEKASACTKLPLLAPPSRGKKTMFDLPAVAKAAPPEDDIDPLDALDELLAEICGAEPVKLRCKDQRPATRLCDDILAITFESDTSDDGSPAARRVASTRDILARKIADPGCVRLHHTLPPSPGAYCATVASLLNIYTPGSPVERQAPPELLASAASDGSDIVLLEDPHGLGMPLPQRQRRLVRFEASNGHGLNDSAPRPPPRKRPGTGGPRSRPAGCSVAAGGA
eukprot:TRINITY_DN30834_c0_g1_i1.p1 TRINITY_DN30834_c0_g1~~TRINITY_DN30834_c0_g1_i1.p1  ORF type:complete len:417 (+),score=76.22 TRINITY_DN30834_c0_g1_i1:128-1378(+)